MKRVYCIFCCEEMMPSICAYWCFDKDNNSAHMYCLENKYMECPRCEDQMTYEEGLYWCDECGLNSDATAYHQEKEKKESNDDRD